MAPARKDELLLLSASSAERARGRARAVRAALAADADAASFCASAAARTPEAHRIAVVGSSGADLAARLDDLLSGSPAEGSSVGRVERATPLVFVFGGQGAEWWAMGRELYATEPVFADQIRACERALGARGASITRELGVVESESRLADVEVLQPTLFAVHAGLVALLRSWGIAPDCVVGHSFGEVSAAWAAGALTLEDALRVHVVRSRVMKRLAGLGRMVVVEAGVEDARRALQGLGDRAVVGVVNSPGSVVLSGEPAAIDEAVARLAAKGIGHRMIHMPYAVHSPAMGEFMPEVSAALDGLAARAPTIPLFSTVTGGAIDRTDGRHWARNIGEIARFSDAIGAILARGPATFVEIGPHPILGAVIAQNAAFARVDCHLLSTLRRQRPERAQLLAMAGSLFTRGRSVSVYDGAPRDDARLESALATAVDDVAPAPSLVDALRSLDPSTRLARLVAHVAGRVARRLRLDSVDATTPLRELGLDSAGAVELTRALGDELGRRFPATLFFEFPTVQEAAEHIGAELGLLPRAPARRRRTATRSDPGEPIAIVGIGCRFPGGVDGPEALWRLLEREVDAVTEVPASRWNGDDTFDPDQDAPGKTYSKWAGFLGDVDRFDAAFFGIAPREAQSMDPQQRLLLEVSWEALEDAGIPPRSLAGTSTGVFVGLCTNDYGGPLLNGDPRDIDAYTFTGNSASVAAGRIAYVLGLEGPALVVDTACSSSLVALHLACRSLRSGECDVALAGGVNAILSPTLLVYFSRLRAMSPTGRSRAFDAAADGYVRGEGCGLVVLKRLADARADGDRVVALVRGSALNQDGRSNGLTAPNGRAQEAVIGAALEDAGIAPHRVGYVEAHGTGTPLGDPIELRAIAAALGEGRAQERPLLVGSIKTNIGHTEGAAGIAGVIKAALALHHKRIPRSLHFHEPNPHVPWSELPLRVAARATPWDSDEPRVAGVSSFGFSGTNAHVVLEEAPGEAEGPPPDENEAAVPVIVSARTERALRAQLDRLGRFVEQRPSMRTSELARALSTTRTHFEKRAGASVRSREELLTVLRERRFVEGEARRGAPAFLFTGQGSQRARMGASLHAQYHVFRDSLERTLAAVDARMDRPLREVLFAQQDPALDETGFAQPALFAIEVALFHLLASWGIAPGWVAGHSVGEISAAHVAGVLSLEDACALVVARGRLMQALPRGGAMASIDATEEEVRPHLVPGAVELAAVNGPRSVVVSGEESAVARVAEMLAMRGRRSHRLRVSHAFHSPLMDPMLAELRRVAEGLDFTAPRIPLVSTVTGAPVDAEPIGSAEYWVRQARAPVRFADAVRALADAGAATCVELGPQAVLSGLGPDCVPGERTVFVPTLRKDVDDANAMADTLVRLHVRGLDIDWVAALGPRRERLDLPTYAFQGERHWVQARAVRHTSDGVHPWLDGVVPLATTGGSVLTGAISLETAPWLAGHMVGGDVILPGTAFLELALEAARRLDMPRVEELTLEAPLPLGSATRVEIQIAVDPADAAGRRAFGLHARVAGADWRRHASGALGPGDAGREAARTPWPPVGASPLDTSGLYPRLATLGLEYGDSFRRVVAAWRLGDELFVDVALREGRSEYNLHPALLDAALHVMLGEVSGETLSLPFSWTGTSLSRRGSAALRVRVARGARSIAVDAMDPEGRYVASVSSLVTRPVPAARVVPVHRVSWSSKASSEAAIAGEWWLGGAEWPGLDAAVAAHGGSLRFMEGVADLAAAVEERGSCPEVVAWHEPAADPRLGARSTLAFLQLVLGNARFAGAKAALLTRGALVTGPEDEGGAICHAAAGALTRAASSEHAARTIVHLDVDADRLSIQRLPAAMAAGEALVALRRGELRVPQPPRRASVGSGGRGFATDGDVLITGGTGGLGALVARHLVRRHGVRRLVLASRRGETAPGTEALRRELQEAGARVTIVACDVTRRDEVARLLAQIPTLRGVIHAAGALDDGLIGDLDGARVDTVFAPKVDAALHLDELTGDRPLEYFVLFSSVAAQLAPAGQGTYAAANAALDALAWRRRAGGLHALAVNFGPWAEAGMSARLGSVHQARLSRLGLGSLSTSDALAALDAAMTSGEPQLTVAVFTEKPPPRREDTGGLAELGALVPEARDRAVREWVRAQAARLLRLASPSDLPCDRPLRELGMDSLVAVELRDLLSAGLGHPLPAGLAFDYPDVDGLARWLSAQIAPERTAADRVDEMSEGELDALLASLKGAP